MSFMLGMISVFANINAILIALVIIFIVVIFMTLISIQTKYDFINCCMITIFLLITFTCFAIAVGLSFAIYYSQLLQTVYGGIAAILIIIFLISETRFLICNKRKFRYDKNEYVIAALQLYIGYCDIFSICAEIARIN